MNAKLYQHGPKPQIAIVGYGRHGKDTVARILDGVGPFKCSGSTSWQLLPFMASKLRVAPQYAWEERHANREAWKAHGDYLRRTDACFLIRLCLEAGNIVPGIRDRVEMQQALDEKLFDAVLWVERPGYEADSTVTFDKSLATDVIFNDGDLHQLRAEVLGWALTKGFISVDEANAALRHGEKET